MSTKAKPLTDAEFREWLRETFPKQWLAIERDVEDERLRRRLYVALVEQRVIDSQKYGEAPYAPITWEQVDADLDPRFRPATPIPPPTHWSDYDPPAMHQGDREDCEVCNSRIRPAAQTGDDA